MRRQCGLSLIELVIVLAVIAILATIGWPMYLEQGRINNRTDAILATNAVALALNQFESDNGSFVWNTPPGAATVAEAHNRFYPTVNVGVNNNDPTLNNTCAEQRGFRYSTENAQYESCRGYYSITVNIVAGTAYTITTTALGEQVKDKECDSFTLNNLGAKGIVDNSSGLVSSTKRCWGSS